jgi:Pentapeptide repeats (8 copies)
MRPLSNSLSVVLVVGCLSMVVALAGEPACDGPYKGRKLTPEELETVLRNHYQWQETQGDPNDARRANLCQADLTETNLQKAKLSLANLQEAKLIRADLQEADLVGANFQRAYLPGAKLQKASLLGAILQEASLFGANLEEADLSWANLQEASLMDANLRKVIYEPIPGKLPMFWTLTEPENQLETLRFRHSPAALIELREAFKKGGMRMQERQLTYAIEHTKMLLAWDPSWNSFKLLDTRPWVEKLAGKSESLFSYVLFELTSGYGMAPSRALATLGFLILVFALVYMVALETACGRAGIWVTWPADRVYQEEGAKEAARVTTAFFFPRVQDWAAGRWWGVLLRGVCLPLIGLYFSLLSAFSLGWRELNVGTWIARVQSREYVLRATGWVRTVAGIQSLLSVYLLALWVLTYFGRPFE